MVVSKMYRLARLSLVRYLESRMSYKDKITGKYLFIQ